MHRRSDVSHHAAPVVPPLSAALRLSRSLVCLAALTTATLFAQLRPTPPIVVVPPIGGGGGAGGGGITPPIISPPIVLPPGGGGGGGITVPTALINAPRGALVGDPVTATAVVVDPTLPAGTTVSAAYQWSVTGARLLSDPRSAAIQFVADRAGNVTLSVSISSNGSAYNPSTTVTVLAGDSAGSVSTVPTVAANTLSVTATVPAAVNNDRTFRWVVSGDAAITGGQGTRSITFRPGSPGTKEIVCNVTLQNVVTVPIRAYVVVTGTGQPTEVSIASGSGDGIYPAGTRVDIFANPPPEGQVFDRWTGDTATLGNGPLVTFLPRTTLTVPATPVTLTATYKPAPAWRPTVVENFNPQNQTVSGQSTVVATTLAYHVPAPANGIVFLLHDTGGSGADWFSRPEQLLLARDLVAAGYGVAALHSANRTTGAWAQATTLATNLDARNHAAAHDRLVAAAPQAAGKPVFFLGVADGAAAALRYADLLGAGANPRLVKGAVLYSSPGIDTLAVTSRIPQFFAFAANDDALGNQGVLALRDSAQLLLGRGVATGTATQAITPVHPTRFRTLALTRASFSTADAETIWTTVKNAGVLDANNYPRSVPSAATLSAALPAALRECAADVAAQLAVAAAANRFFADANPRVLQFLNARAADAPTAAPGRLVNLSARSNVAHLTDAFTVGFTLSGTARATVLLRAVGPTLSRFGVGNPLGAPRLELYQGSRQLAANEGWDRVANAPQVATAAATVGAFALPTGSNDAAILTQLDPGSYTMTIRGLGATTGLALAELYDISRNATRLTNLSTLTRIDDEGGLVIPGVVIAGNNPRTVVVRAVSAGLTDLGFAARDVISDPRLTILSGNQLVAQNNNWAQANAPLLNAVFPAIGAFPLRAAADSALIDAFAPGAYTLQAGAAPAGPNATGSPNQTGAILIELYEVP